MTFANADELKNNLPRLLPFGRLNHSVVDRTASDRLTRYMMLNVVLVCQFLTVVVSWPVWNVRVEPVNLPLFNLPVPPISFGLTAVGCLLIAFLRPRLGIIAFAGVWVVSLLFDQYRLQPQFLSLLVLMFACVYDRGIWFARMFLSAMWFWAGLHKLLSDDWLGYLSYGFVEGCGFVADVWHFHFAIVIALFEIALGVLAVLAPRRAAMFCLLLHAGILLSLSPMLLDYNVSVWPWNLATAIVGRWVLLQKVESPRFRFQVLSLSMLFVAPIGFYFGLVNAHLAFVLYSGNMPRAIHTKHDAIRPLHAWTGLRVPFPDSPRLFVQVFQQTATAGEKLCVDDPRPRLPDQYFLKTANGAVQEITKERFYRADDDSQEVSGIETVDPNLYWKLSRSGVELHSSDNLLVTAATVDGLKVSEADLELLNQLPNLQSVTFVDVEVDDAMLEALTHLWRLESLKFERCPISDSGFEILARMQRLRSLHVTGTEVAVNVIPKLSQLRKNPWVLCLPSAGRN